MQETNNDPTQLPSPVENSDAPASHGDVNVTDMATLDAADSSAGQTLDRVTPVSDPLERRRWWLKLCLQPLLFLAAGATLIAGLGVAQQLGFISAGGGHNHASSEGGANYICPMMCTPPQSEPGRCPVCAMDLVQATSGGGGGARHIKIDPAARRVANIRTVAVMSMPVTRTIKAVGELAYNEAGLKTISAYVGGRLEHLDADTNGVVVEKGGRLATVYSPKLYSGQVELLLAKNARDDKSLSGLPEMARSNRELYEGARQRLIEFGMTAQQIADVEKSGKAHSRLQVFAPISGTVIEKLAVEGQYVKEGDAIYKLADLSSVWLMLNLFPEEAAAIDEGQVVSAEMQSMPGREFIGQVEFINPHVDRKTRTVGVRIVFPNLDGQLRIGDYAKATIEVDLGLLAGHEQPVIPRNAVLNVGTNSVVYVETEIGRFEIREVVLGPNCGDMVVVESGLAEGEYVATRGNFLIDSQMQLAGNPSLIDPTKALPRDDEMSPTMLAVLERMNVEDREMVESQAICPVADQRLGSMGMPKKVDVNGTLVFICCEACRESLLETPDRYLAKLDALKSGGVVEPTVPALPEMGDFELLVPEEAPTTPDPQGAFYQPSSAVPCVPFPSVSLVAYVPSPIGPISWTVKPMGPMGDGTNGTDATYGYGTNGTHESAAGFLSPGEGLA